MPGLRGRLAEQAVLDRLLTEVRAGESRVLALRGEVGVGKTSLLDYLQAHAPGFRVTRTVGVESEAVHLPRTAEYHLHKVYAKLGVSSRRQLRHRLAQLEGSTA